MSAVGLYNIKQDTLHKTFE